jgi:hypothetical protein
MHEDIPSNCGRSGINCGRHRRLAMLGIFSAAVLTVAGCQFPAPSPGDGASFSKVAAAEPNQAWAVGHYDQNGQSHALLEYWNGKAWQLISVDVEPLGTPTSQLPAPRTSGLSVRTAAPTGTGRSGERSAIPRTRS